MQEFHLQALCVAAPARVTQHAASPISSWLDSIWELNKRKASKLVALTCIKANDAYLKTIQINNIDTKSAILLNKMQNNSDSL